MQPCFTDMSQAPVIGQKVDNFKTDQIEPDGTQSTFDMSKILEKNDFLVLVFYPGDLYFFQGHGLNYSAIQVYFSKKYIVIV